MLLDSARQRATVIDTETVSHHRGRCPRCTRSSTLPEVSGAVGAKSGTSAVLVSAVLFGTTGTVLVGMPTKADAWSAGALRLLIGAAALWAIASVTADRDAPRPPRASTLIGGIGVAVFQVGYFLAVERTGVAIGTVTTIGSGPVLAGIGEAVAARRLPERAWLAGTGTAVAGVVALGVWGRTADGPRVVDVLGLALAVAAGGGWATFTSVSRRQIAAGTASTVSMAAIFSGGAVLVAPALAVRQPSWLLSGWGPAVALYLGVLTVGVAYWSYGYALRHLPAPTVITLTLLEPITAALLGVFVVGEHLTAAGWTGVAAVVAGLLVTGRAAMHPRSVPTASGTVTP